MNIFIIGGQFFGNTEREDEILDSCEEYFPKCNRWKTISPMSTKRAPAAAAFYREKIFVFGGCTKPDETTGLCEMYSISLECWSRIASLPVPRRCASSVVVDNAIYLLCGEDEDKQCVDAVERYREDDGWLTVAQMPTGRSLTSASRLTFAKVFLESCENFR